MFWGEFWTFSSLLKGFHSFFFLLPFFLRFVGFVVILGHFRPYPGFAFLVMFIFLAFFPDLFGRGIFFVIFLRLLVAANPSQSLK